MNKTLKTMLDYPGTHTLIAFAESVFDEMSEDNENVFVSINGTDMVNVEVLEDEDKVICLTYRRTAKFIQACLFDAQNQTTISVDWKTNENVRLAILLALGAIASLENVSITEALNEGICDISLPPSGTIKTLQTSQILVSYSLNGDEQIYGGMNSMAYGRSVSSSAKIRVKKSDLDVLFTFGEGVEGHEYIKKELPENWIPVKETIMAAKNISHFRDMKEAGRGFRNILVRGVPGCGKSFSMGTVLAQMLGLPLSIINLKKGMIAEDLMNSISPDISSSNTSDSLPTIDEIAFDKCTAYKRLTGNEPVKDITEREVINELVEKAKKQGSANTLSYKLIERPLMKVFENGGLLLINEVAAVDSDLLMSLASALEEGIIDDPVTGRTIKRHPKCVIVMTYNPDTLSSHGVDEAIKSRCAGSFYEFLTPTAETFKKQIMKRGEYDEELVDKCIKCFFTMKDNLRDSMDTSGNLGARELYAWIELASLWEDPVLTSEQSVIIPATEDETQAEVLRDIVQTTFAA